MSGADFDVVASAIVCDLITRRRLWQRWVPEKIAIDESQGRLGSRAVAVSSLGIPRSPQIILWQFAASVPSVTFYRL
jgi:hypothetical protein